MLFLPLYTPCRNHLIQTYVDFIPNIQSGGSKDIKTPHEGGGHYGQPMLFTYTEKAKVPSPFTPTLVVVPGEKVKRIHSMASFAMNYRLRDLLYSGISQSLDCVLERGVQSAAITSWLRFNLLIELDRNWHDQVINHLCHFSLHGGDQMAVDIQCDGCFRVAQSPEHYNYGETLVEKDRDSGVAQIVKSDGRKPCIMQ